MEEINYRLQSAQSAPPPPTIMARLQSAPQSAPQSGSPPPINMARFQIAPQSAPPPPTIMARLQSAPQSAPQPPTIMARFQSAPQSTPPPPMANRDNINSSPNSRDPRDINSWNQNVQILPEKAIISNSEPSGVGMIGGGGVGNSNIRGAGKQKPYACTYCEKKFSHVHLMKQHVRIHTGEKPFACKYCEKRFTQSHSVKGHELIHTGEKPFACKFCDYRCRNMANLKKHEIIHIRDMINSDKNPQEKYSQNIHFKKKQHVRIHKREKKFACKYCEKRFTQAHSVKGHEFIHTGEKPFACKSCSYRCRNMANLKKHENIHIKDINFKTQKSPH